MKFLRWGLKTTVIFLVLLTATVSAAQENADFSDVIQHYYEDQAPDGLDRYQVEYF